MSSPLETKKLRRAGQPIGPTSRNGLDVASSLPGASFVLALP
jgi:hypothetical protein